jgi:hypothetical protein
MPKSLSRRKYTNGIYSSIHLIVVEAIKHTILAWQAYQHAASIWKKKHMEAERAKASHATRSIWWLIHKAHLRF